MSKETVKMGIGEGGGGDTDMANMFDASNKDVTVIVGDSDIGNEEEEEDDDDDDDDDEHHVDKTAFLRAAIPSLSKRDDATSCG